MGVPKPSVECRHAPRQNADKSHLEGAQCLRPSSKAGQFCMVLKDVGIVQLVSDGHQEVSDGDQEVSGQRQPPRGGKERNLWQAMDGEADSPLLAF